MIVDAFSAVKTGHFRLLDDLLEIAVFAVVENPREVSTGPEFPPCFVCTTDKLEGRLMPLGRGRLKFIGHWI